MGWKNKKLFKTLRSLVPWVSTQMRQAHRPFLKKGALMLGAFFGGMGFASISYGAEVEAKKDGVEIYSDATNKSEVLGTLKAGETLESVERKGMFWQVKTKDSKTGYVSILAVKHKPDTNTNLAKAINGVVKGGRSADDASESRARSAVMGVRGLREDDDMANASSVRPNLRAVYEMEDIKVSQKKIGDLGEKVMGEIARKAEKQ